MVYAHSAMQGRVRIPVSAHQDMQRLVMFLASADNAFGHPIKLNILRTMKAVDFADETTLYKLLGQMPNLCIVLGFLGEDEKKLWDRIFSWAFSFIEGEVEHMSNITARYTRALLVDEACRRCEEVLESIYSRIIKQRQARFAAHKAAEEKEKERLEFLEAERQRAAAERRALKAQLKKKK